MSNYMFDTNIFNGLLDGTVDPSKLHGKVCYATHVQADEILATKNADRRSQLSTIFAQVLSEQIPTESFVLDVSRLGEARLSDGVTYSQLLDSLNQLNKGKPNNIQDVLIAETAIANSLILVTEDHDLARVVTEFGGAVCTLNDLLA
jgi:predicted nucleic acid-binding protein